MREADWPPPGWGVAHRGRPSSPSASTPAWRRAVGRVSRLGIVGWASASAHVAPARAHRRGVALLRVVRRPRRWSAPGPARSHRRRSPSARSRSSRRPGCSTSGGAPEARRNRVERSGDAGGSFGAVVGPLSGSLAAGRRAAAGRSRLVGLVVLTRTSVRSLRRIDRNGCAVPAAQGHRQRSSSSAMRPDGWPARSRSTTKTPTATRSTVTRGRRWPRAPAPAEVHVLSVPTAPAARGRAAGHRPRPGGQGLAVEAAAAVAARAQPAQEVDRKLVEEGGRSSRARSPSTASRPASSAWSSAPRSPATSSSSAPGVKVARVTSLHKDIAYAMASPDVRILAPIPGRQAIGVEVPNSSRHLVARRHPRVARGRSSPRHPLEVAVGRDINGKSVLVNLATMPHLLIAGATGAGKSTASTRCSPRSSCARRPTRCA